MCILANIIKMTVLFMALPWCALNQPLHVNVPEVEKSKILKVGCGESGKVLKKIWFSC